MTPPRARRVPAPGTHPAVAKYDYASAYELPAPPTPPIPEWWARAVFEHAPAFAARFIVFGWRGVLGLKLGSPRAPELVAGWPIIAADGGELVMGASSWLLDTQNIVTVTPAKITWITVVRYRRPLGRVVWALAALVHHRAITGLLSRAARSLRW
ncbi:hypothetical protein AB0I28_07565 [Phytomonospora sp. NPDC050363]|uniref:hypothetical protein n=1 Tax=Phytomonospora sp. NPDC050363 TaxID=3155642 RepID=UPI003400BCE3